MKLPQKKLERKLFKSGYGYVIGVDEVGMGCLAGPVVVCAVGMTKDFYKKSYPTLRGLRESKLLSAIQREKFATELLKVKDLVYAISPVYPKMIDKINIYQASRLAMRRAVVALRLAQGYQNYRLIVLVDGKTKIKGVAYEQMSIVKGDRKVFVIACASIMAKVYRDKMMARYAKKYPGYGFEKHKGYGTKYHQTQLGVLGPSLIHRRSFKLTF